MVRITAYVFAFFIIVGSALIILTPATNKISAPAYKSNDKITLLWDKNMLYTPGCAEYANVISTPLYALENNDGNICMKELHDTEKYLSSVDKPVWGMYTNGFNPDNTRTIITDPEKRAEITDFISETAVNHKLSGVNIDFENMYSDDSGYFTEFIKELSEKLSPNNITLSVDVTKINKGSMFYSMCYNRSELSKYADYIILMAYDQFPRTSDVAGPVSSIPWTEDAVKGLLSEVEADKLLLGIPFYTRNWSEQDGIVQSCPAISMTESSELISKFSPVVYNDSETGLDYFQYETDGKTNKVWQENVTSLEKRCEIADRHNLAGIACWSLGFESDEAKQFLDSRNK